MLTGVKPTVVKDRRYSIDETCDLLGIHRHTLTRYTENGLIVPVMHSCNHRLYYTGAEISRFWNQTI